MNLILTTLPDDPAEARRWLDRQLVSTHLPQLAGELAACHDASPAEDRTEDRATDRTAQQVIGEPYSQVLDAGTSVLSDESLAELLTHPELLFSLQADVLTAGGSYWQTIVADESELARRQAGKKQLASWLAEQTSSSPAVVLPADPDSKHRERQQQDRRQQGSRRLLNVLALAASLLIAGWIGHQTAAPPTVAPAAPTNAIAWGWAKPDALNTTLDRDAYLQSLATAAEVWSKKRPDTPEALAKRISEFRQGCSRLILADHKPLPEADATWLKEKCLAWAKKIDAHLLVLETTGDVATARTAMDTTVEKLVSALHNRTAA